LKGGIFLPAGKAVIRDQTDVEINNFISDYWATHRGEWELAEIGDGSVKLRLDVPEGTVRIEDGKLSVGRE